MYPQLYCETPNNAILLDWIIKGCVWLNVKYFQVKMFSGKKNIFNIFFNNIFSTFAINTVPR